MASEAAFGKEDAASQINAIIAEQKSDVIAKIAHTVRSYIEGSTRTKCLTLVTETKSGTQLRTLEPDLSEEYVTALIAFCRKKEWRGEQLNSALSSPVSNIVANEFSEAIEQQSDRITEAVLPHLLRSDLFNDALSKAVVDAYKGALPQAMKKKIVGLLSGKLKAILTSQLDVQAAVVVKSTAASIATSISAPIAAKISVIIVKSLAPIIKSVIVKILASSAFKAAVLAKVKAVVAAALLAAFVKIVGTKLALGSGATLMWVLIPIFAAWLAREAYVFPKKLAEKVSDAVRSDLSGEYESISLDISEKISVQLFGSVLSKLATEIVNDVSIHKLIDEAASESS